MCCHKQIAPSFQWKRKRDSTTSHTLDLSCFKPNQQISQSGEALHTDATRCIHYMRIMPMVAGSFDRETLVVVSSRISHDVSNRGTELVLLFVTWSSVLRIVLRVLEDSWTLRTVLSKG
jgi:hypothetical protein